MSEERLYKVLVTTTIKHQVYYSTAYRETDADIIEEVLDMTNHNYKKIDENDVITIVEQVEDIQDEGYTYVDDE
jgi:hypothetical protein